MMERIRTWMSSLTGRVALVLAGLFLIVQLVTVWAFYSMPGQDGTGWAAHMMAWSLMSAVLVIAYAVWAIRRLTAPYIRFARAAERLIIPSARIIAGGIVSLPIGKFIKLRAVCAP